MSSKIPRLTEVFVIREDSLTEEPPDVGLPSPDVAPDPFQSAQQQSKIETQADGSLLVTSQTSKPGSFTLTTADFDQIVKQLKGGKQVQVKVLAKGNKKPLATLNTNDVKTAFFTGKTPTLQQLGHDKKAGSMSGGEYWIVNIPKNALGKN